jgi:hypothetical protein
MYWESKQLVWNGDHKIEIYYCETIFVPFNSCIAPNIICFNPLTQKHNCLQYPITEF